MAEKNDKWLMFKQYMHNELGITKEDIREWIRDAIKDEAKQLIQQTGFTPQDAIRMEVNRAIRDTWGNDVTRDIKEAAGKILAENITLTLKKE